MDPAPCALLRGNNLGSLTIKMNAPVGHGFPFCKVNFAVRVDAAAHTDDFFDGRLPLSKHDRSIGLLS